MDSLLANLAFELLSEAAGTNGESKAWVHIVPSGTFSAIDGRGPWHLKNPAAVIEATMKFHGQKQMVIDYEHQTFAAAKNGKPAPAAGWISGLQARPDGIWALTEWTPNAAKLIAAREYRYLSPVISFRSDGEVLLIQNVALTNSPALDVLTALATAQLEDFEPMDTKLLAEKLAAAISLLNWPAETTPQAVIELTRKLIPLAEELLTLTGSNEKLTSQAVQTLIDPSKFVPIGEFKRVVSEMNKLRQGVEHNDAVSLVEDHISKGMLLPYLRSWAIELCKQNKPAYDAFLTDTGPVVFSAIFEPQSKKLGKGARPERLNDEENAIRVHLGLTVEEFRAANLD